LEFNYLGTNWVHPLYELPFTGGFPDRLGAAPDSFADGEIGKLQSIVPGSGPNGVRNDPRRVGDDPNLRATGQVRRDRRCAAGIPAARHPSGLANEMFLDVYVRRASFEPWERNLQHRLFDAYAAEVRASTKTATASFPLRRETSTRRPTASPTTRASTCRRRFSSASP